MLSSHLISSRLDCAYKTKYVALQGGFGLRGDTTPSDDALGLDELDLVDIPPAMVG